MPGQTAYTNLKPRDASRFLHQATFGATTAEISRVQTIGYGAWLDEQFAMPARDPHVAALAPGLTRISRPDSADVLDSFWRQVILGPDELRQRVAFALSQIGRAHV